MKSSSRYDELVEGAKRFQGAALQETIQRLARNNDFAAVIGWIEQQRESWVQTASSQTLAGNSGKQTHAAGSLYAINLLRSQLKIMMDKTERNTAGG